MPLAKATAPSGGVGPSNPVTKKHGDLTVRLPSFKLVELQRISEVFNGLAANLDRTTREKQALAAKLGDAETVRRILR